MDWYKKAEKPVPDDGTIFIAGFDVIRFGVPHFESAICFISEDGQPIECSSEYEIGWSKEDITHWSEWNPPKEIIERKPK
jgi:hypothetical protein